MPYTYIAHLQLNGGQRVVDPRDLLPVVAAKSPTATAANAYGVALEDGARGAWIGLGATGGITWLTAVVAVVGVPMITDSDPTNDNLGLGLVLGGGSAAFLTLSLAMPLAIALPGVIAQQQATSERETAFSTYDRSLRQYLGLPEEGPIDAPGG